MRVRPFTIFKLMIWKDFHLMARTPAITFFRITVPIFFTMLLVVIKYHDPKAHAPIVYPSYCAIQQFQDENLCSDVPDGDSSNDAGYDPPKILPMLDLKKLTLAYCPDNIPFVNKAMEGMNKYFLDVDIKESCDTFAEEVAYDGDNKLLAGLEFHAVLPENSPDDGPGMIPINIDLKLRFPSTLRGIDRAKEKTNIWMTQENKVPAKMVGPGPRTQGLKAGEYTKQGFITLMGLTTYEMIRVSNEVLKRKFVFPEVRMRQFPYPSWTNALSGTAVGLTLVALTGLAALCQFLGVVRTFVLEKELKLKVAMKVMGVPHSIHWVAQFVSAFIIVLLVALPTSAILGINWYPVKSYVTANETETLLHTALLGADTALIYVFLISYSASAITLGFALATLFSSTTRATIISLLTFFLGFMPFMLFMLRDEPVSIFKQILGCLCLNSAMGQGWMSIFKWEYIGEGAQFNNLWESPEGTTCPLGYIIIMMFVDAVLHMIFTLYTLALFPEDESTPKHWNFLFTKKFWCPTAYANSLQSQTNMYTSQQRYSHAAKYLEEEPPAHLSVGVDIIGMKKVYGGNIVAVKDLNMKMYEGQTTVIIGQANAGKTTIMRLLGGLVSPTSGTAMIYGHDVTKHIARIRHKIGYCSHSNIIYNHLSIEDNLRFFTMIRGVSKAEAEAEVKYFIDLLELRKKRKKVPDRLTPEDKRKLSIAIAFCGHAKVILLDEPSFGLKFEGKRGVWDLINLLKVGRTVIVNTLFIDEAEALGDRIAIIAEGELQCYGSLNFLRRKFGVGYYLHVQVKPKLHIPLLTRMLRFYIPRLREPEVLENDKGEMYELHYMLPKSHSDVFGPMLADLEGPNGTNIGVRGYSVNVISLGEVFLKIITHQHYKSRIKYQSDGPSESTRRPRKPLFLTSGLHLIFNHFIAMFMKRSRIFARNLLPFFFMLLVIVFISWFAMSEVSSFRPFIILKARKLLPHKQIGHLAEFKNTLDKNAHNMIMRVLKKLRVEIVDSIVDVILAKRNENNFRFNHEEIVTAVTFESPKQNYVTDKIRVTTWYSENFYHSEGTAAARAFALIYSLATGNNRIHFYNHPFSFEVKIEESRNDEFARHLQVTILLSLIMSIIAAYFSMFYVMERTSQSKHLQIISGVTMWVYLLVRFICDYMIYLLIAVFLLLLLCAYQKDGFDDIHDMYQIFMLFLAFGFVAIPLTHIISKAYTKPENAVIKVTTFNFLTGVLLFTLIWAFEKMEMKKLDTTLHIFSCWPFYNVMNAFQTFQERNVREETCKAIFKNCQEIHTSNTEYCLEKYCTDSKELGFTCCLSDVTWDVVEDFYSFGAMGTHLLHFYGSGFFLFILISLWEYGGLRKIGWLLARIFTKTRPVPEHDEDERVLRERIRISKYPESGVNYMLVLKNVTKTYGGKAIVNGLCVGVKRGECFGLFGPKGAGKTTIFRLITGTERIGFGSIYIFGKRSSYRTEALIKKYTGYCPQDDAMLPDLTVKETLIIHSLIKGVRMRDTIRMASTLAKDLEFHEHLDKKIKMLSRGNKRKVSVALSLIGKPKIIFMDEPTMGMDPKSKKLVWKVLASVRDRGVSIFMTTHSMPECDALCNRLGIMIQGTFNAMGSMKMLKEKFSKGYTVTIRLEDCENLQDEIEKMEDIEDFFEANFSNVILIETHEKKMTFFTEDKDILCSTMFKEMEKAKEEYHIKEYSIGQSKLEQVFLYFTRRQGA